MRGCAAGQDIKFRTRLSLIGYINSCESDLIINRVLPARFDWLINSFLYFQATKVINIMLICLYEIGNKLL